MVNLFYNYDNDIPVEEARSGENLNQFVVTDSKTTLLKNIKGDILGIRNNVGVPAEAYFCVEAPELNKLWDFGTFYCDLTDKADEIVYSYPLEKYKLGVLRLYIDEELPKSVYHMKVYMQIPHECDYAALINFDSINLEITLDFSEGDKTYERPLANQFYKAVTVKCPGELKPENILKGVTIAGITGTYDPLCTIECITPGCTVEENGDETVITVKDTELAFSEADPAIGRVIDGWWAGIKVSLRDEALVKIAKYSNVDPTTGEHVIKSFDKYKDTPLSIGLWGCYSDDYLNLLSPEKTTLTYRWWFDINGDGVFEHKVVLVFDVSTIRLIGRDPEYITFDEEDSENAEVESTESNLETSDKIDDSDDENEVINDPDDELSKVTIIYENESQNENLEPRIDTYLIFAGNGALLSIE